MVCARVHLVTTVTVTVVMGTMLLWVEQFMADLIVEFCSTVTHFPRSLVSLLRWWFSLLFVPDSHSLCFCLSLSVSLSCLGMKKTWLSLQLTNDNLQSRKEAAERTPDGYDAILSFIMRQYRRGLRVSSCYQWLIICMRIHNDVFLDQTESVLFCRSFWT